MIIVVGGQKESLATCGEAGEVDLVGIVCVNENASSGVGGLSDIAQVIILMLRKLSASVAQDPSYMSGKLSPRTREYTWMRVSVVSVSDSVLKRFLYTFQDSREIVTIIDSVHEVVHGRFGIDWDFVQLLRLPEKTIPVLKVIVLERHALRCGKDWLGYIIIGFKTGFSSFCINNL